jgi:hypothetical protein
MRNPRLCSVILLLLVSCGIDGNAPKASSHEAQTGDDPELETISVTFDGTARGRVFITDAEAFQTLAECDQSCKIHVASGTQVSLFGYTPSAFAGWSGACSTSDHECDLGAVTRDTAAVVAFVPDEHAIATLRPRQPVLGLALAPDGTVVISDSTGVIKMSLAGDVVWKAAISTARDLAIDDAGEVFGLTSSGMFALTADGALAWTRTFATARNNEQLLDSKVATSPDGSVIAVMTDDGAHVVDGTGADRFVVTGWFAESISVAPDGTVGISVPSDLIEKADVVRYSATGVPQATLFGLPGEYNPSIAYDPQGFLAAATTGFELEVVSRNAQDGSVAFASGTDVESVGPAAIGVAVDSASDVIGVRTVNDNDFPPGMHFDAFSSSGALIATLDKPANEVVVADQFFDDGVFLSMIAGSTSKRFAIAGNYNLGEPWIEVFQLP